MKILHLNTHEKSGGAAAAATRIHKGLLEKGVRSVFRVAHKLSDDPSIISSEKLHEKASALVQEYFDRLPTFMYPSLDQSYYFSAGWFPGINLRKVLNFKPDIVHLHWIAAGFIRIESISQIQCPIVWTIHDSWAFTGGCHIPFNCKHYIKNCGKCPSLGSYSSSDLSKKVLSRKKKAWNDSNMTIVAPSMWLAECAKKSSLFRNSRVEVIPNGIDTSRFKPVETDIAREILNLPKNKKLILFGALCAFSDKNKGYDLLTDALKKLSNRLSDRDIELVIFGISKPPKLPDLYFKTHFPGYLYDDISMAVTFSAADVMVVPSYQEAFGLTAAEAMACGTPVAAFDSSGLKDIVDNKINGYLARPFDTEDLAKGIEWIIQDKNRWNMLSQQARKKIEQKFSLKKITEIYIDLYKNILD